MNRTILKGLVYTGLFIIPFVPFFVSSSFFFPFITTKAFVWRIIVEVVFAAWVLLACIEPEYRPKRSWIAWALLAFLVVIGLADIFGIAPVKSFWSNFERMEGYVTLLHLALYFLVVGSLFSEVDWRRWWKTNIVASVGMVGYAVLQLAHVPGFDIHQGGARVDGTFGNAEYLAVYMLICVFAALYYFVREERLGWKWFLAVATLLDAWVIYESATRGAILGLLGGLLVVALLNLKNRASPRLRLASITYVVAFVVIVAGFFALRSTAFVQESPTLSRFATISLSELSSEGRSYIWPMAVKGIMERPILGWGQDNFNYVFDEHYSPEMFRLEPWFDRAHNIFLDWGVQGGVLGLLAYLSLYAAFLWLVWKRDEHFTHAEKSILTGLLAAYFFNNFFVFDNLVSYVLFFSLLAYVHMRATDGSVSTSKAYTSGEVTAVGLPVAVVLLGVVLYFVNIRPIMANATLIDGLSIIQAGGDMHGAVQDLEAAYHESRLGRPEVAEQVAANAPTVLQSSSLSVDEKNSFYYFAGSAVTAQADLYPTDTRYQILAGSFLSETGAIDQGITYLQKALTLSPGKQTVYYELGAAYINKGDGADAVKIFRQAYELDTEDNEAAATYLAGTVYAGDAADENTFVLQMAAATTTEQVLLDERVLGAYVALKNYVGLIAYLENVARVAPDLKASADQYISQAQTLQK